MKLKGKFRIIILLISSFIEIARSQDNNNEDDNQLNLNIIPATKYKISNRDYNILKSDIESQIMQKLAIIQNNYDSYLNQFSNIYQLYNYNPYSAPNVDIIPQNSPQNFPKKQSNNENSNQEENNSKNTENVKDSLNFLEKEVKNLKVIRDQLQEEINQKNKNQNNKINEKVNQDNNDSNVKELNDYSFKSFLSDKDYYINEILSLYKKENKDEKINEEDIQNLQDKSLDELKLIYNQFKNLNHFNLRH